MNNNTNNDTKKVELVDANLLNPFQTSGNDNLTTNNNQEVVQSNQNTIQNNLFKNENPINDGINNVSTNMTVNTVNQNNSNIVNNNGNINNQNNNFQGTINNNQGVNGLNNVENNVQNNNNVPPYNIQNNVNNNSISNQPMNRSMPNYSNNSDIDDELLRAYIGPNAEKIINQGISWPTFFLGTYYVLYRKMWFLAFILFVISIVATIFLQSLSNIIILGLGIGIFVSFNKIYVNHAKTDIRTIKMQNPNASKEELMSKCQIKGGTSIAAPIIYILILSGLQMYASKMTNESSRYNYSGSNVVLVSTIKKGDLNE